MQNVIFLAVGILMKIIVKLLATDHVKTVSVNQ